MLTVNLESSSATVDNATGLPKVNKRKSKQLVTVKNGQTVMLLVRRGNATQFVAVTASQDRDAG